MGIIKKVILGTLMILGTLLSKGQQDPMYTQYIFNLQTVNPAYVGYWQKIGITLLNRDQWVGFDGHPSTQTLSFQTPLESQNVGLGFNVVLDKSGLEKRLLLNLDYSYRVFLSANTSLRFGIKGGITSYSNNLSEYTQYKPSDPLFQGTIDNKIMPNFGLGLFLSSPTYFLSLSIPKVMQSKYQSNINNFSSVSEVRHLFFAGGMLFDIAKNVKFKPGFMAKIVKGTPFQYDLSGNFLLAEKFWIGGMYRSGDSFGVIAQWVIDRKLRLGYAYDFNTSGLQNFQNGIHEVMISFEFVYAKRRLISPRYF